MLASALRRSFAIRPSHTSRQVIAARQLQTSSRQLARKDTQDKDSLKPESNEYSKSSSDGNSAAMEDAAFNPDKTSPESQHETAKGEADQNGKVNNPLEVSPANQDVSQPKEQPQGQHEGSSSQSGQGPSGRERTSGGSSAPKSGGGKHGGGS